MTPYDQLREMQSLAGVADETLRWLADHVETVTFAPGEVLIVEGASDRDCFFIAAGETEVVRQGAVLGISGAGEPEGELALFLGTPRSATTTAISPVTALRLRSEHYDRLLRDDPAMADDLRVHVCRHLAARFGLPMFAGVPAAPPRT